MTPRGAEYGPWSKTPHGNPCDHYAAGTYASDEDESGQRCPRCGAIRRRRLRPVASPTPRDRADTTPGGSTALSPAAGPPVLRRIALGPLGTAAIGPEVRDQLEHEAARLGVTVSTIGSGSRHRRWTVRVRRDQAFVALEGYEPLPVMLARGLAEFEVRYP